MIRDLIKYRFIFGTSLSLQILACSASFYFLGYSSVIRESWLAKIPDGVVGMFWLQFMWVWFAANGLIGVGAFWTSELNDLFFLEVWRHASFKEWLWRKLQFICFFNTVLYGLGPLPFLLTFYPGEIFSAFSLLALLILYNIHLSLVLFILMLIGIGTPHALSLTLLLHAINVMFNGGGLPNTMQYFLIGEKAGIFSAMVIMGLILLNMWIILVKSTTMTVIKRKD